MLRPARAHARIADSAPAAGARLTVPPVRVATHVNSRIDCGRSRVSLVGPGGARAGL